MPRDVPDLERSQREAIVTTLVRWAEAHPRRDIPLIQFADGSEMTPRDIARALVESESPRGQMLFRVFAAGLIEDNVEPHESLGQIPADFRRDTERWLAQR